MPYNGSKKNGNYKSLILTCTERKITRSADEQKDKHPEYDMTEGRKKLYWNRVDGHNSKARRLL